MLLRWTSRVLHTEVIGDDRRDRVERHLAFAIGDVDGSV